LSQEQLERGLAGQGREFLAGLYENEHPSYEDALDVALAVNPRLAVQWTSEVSAWEAEQRLRGELELRDRQISSLVTSSAAVTGRDAWGSAWRELAGENPEINQLADVMLADLQENQWLAGPVKEQLPGAEKLVIQNLLIRARDANADKVQEARRTQAEAIGREKTAATVASASGSSSPVAGEGGPTDESLERVRRLKAGILNASQGQNVHEAIHGPRT
jgi:cation transport regulator ChaB